MRFIKAGTRVRGKLKKLSMLSFTLETMTGDLVEYHLPFAVTVELAKVDADKYEGLVDIDYTNPKEPKVTRIG